MIHLTIMIAGGKLASFVAYPIIRVVSGRNPYNGFRVRYFIDIEKM